MERWHSAPFPVPAASNRAGGSGEQREGISRSRSRRPGRNSLPSSGPHRSAVDEREHRQRALHALPKLGRKRLPDRLVLQGILFVLHTGMQWEFLPQELGFGSGMTCWRRLAEWNEAGVPAAVRGAFGRAERGREAGLSRAMIDSSLVRAARRGPKADRARSTAPGRAPSTT
ncbi:transposase [Saccharopolyspora sp. ASAGF58]|nr:transposase [Saccharopolyspora sp. ASAGF58]